MLKSILQLHLKFISAAKEGKVNEDVRKNVNCNVNRDVRTLFRIAFFIIRATHFSYNDTIGD